MPLAGCLAGELVAGWRTMGLLSTAIAMCKATAKVSAGSQGLQWVKQIGRLPLQLNSALMHFK